jgi:hypothetical protein
MRINVYMVSKIKALLTQCLEKELGSALNQNFGMAYPMQAQGFADHPHKSVMAAGRARI